MGEKGMSEIEERLSKMGLMRGGHAEQSVAKRLNIGKKKPITHKGGKKK